MSEILVTFGEIAAAQQNVASTAQRLNAQLDDLKRFLAPMVSTWTGQAAEDYQVKQRQWDTSAADLNQVLAQIGIALGHANDGYQQVERANASRWA
ncbi:WXG100 family type VII secretion target [Pseudonocardia acaciae]|uniref:WXG100 family type VII secretion target n=1 Tax=Pseudonocardia acaciae TaxID=551276 RepID=UPI00049148E5|nr:WXG100 family type VII secretion target [Pseudonocardia acaciae]